MRSRLSWIIVALCASCLAWTGTAVAQDDGEPPPEDVEAEAEVEVPPPPRGGAVEDRLERLEERDAERERRDAERQRELEQALARVAELEQAAIEDGTPAEGGEAEAATGPTLRPIGSMFSRMELREGYDDVGAGNPGCYPGPNDGACMRYRARLGLEVGNLRVSDEMVASIRFQPQVTGFWSFGGSGGVTHPAVGLYEGALVLNIDDGVRVDVGRIVLNYGDEMIIGALGWHPAARSFDGARVRFTPGSDGVWVDTFFSVLGEGGAGNYGNADRYFYGVYANLGPALGEGITLDAYALGLQTNDAVDPATGARARWSLRVHLGSRFRYRIDLVDIRAEAGLQVGRQGNSIPVDPSAIIAGHADAEVGFNLAEDRLRISAHGFFASGDDPTTSEVESYNQMFPTAHAFLGFSDVMGGRSNVGGAALHVLGKPIPQLRVSLDMHIFARPETGGADNFAGAEGDLHLIWLPGAGFKVRAMYGVFFPNGSASSLWGSGDPVHYLEVELGYALP